MIKILEKFLRWSDKYSTFFHCISVFLGFTFFYVIFFSPILFNQQLLAFGDGLSYFLPAYYSSKSLWTDLIFGGYPLAADPQNMTWYPPSLLLSWIPHSWNAFIILAYTLAASFSYCYVYILTSSCLAGIVSGIVYSMSGFMISHLSVAGMIHAAAWIPLLICSLDRIRHHGQRRWFFLGGLSLVCCLLGGHPQISVYGVGIGIYYAIFLGWSAPIGRWKYYRYVLGLMTIGLGIAAIQLIPAIELSSLSPRVEMTKEAFFQGSLPLWQVVQYLFPFLFGSDFSLPPYNVPYWSSEANAVEIATYVGILPLMLTAVSLFVNRHQAVTKFWLSVSLITFLIIFGSYLIPSRLMYYVPIYNAFRIPARHSIELALAISVLAGLGVESIQRRLLGTRLLRKILVASLLILISAIGVIIFCNPIFQVKFNQIGIGPSFWPLENPAMGVPLVVFMLSSLSILLFNNRSNSRYAALFLLGSVVLDMTSYGFWFHSWSPNIMPPTSKIELSSSYHPYREMIANQHQRILAQGGIYSSSNYGEYSNSLYTLGAANPIFPNLNRLWNVPLSNGYSPLLLTRVSQLMQLDAAGRLPNAALSNQNRSFDLMSTRYVVSPQPLPIEETGANLQATVPDGRNKRTFWIEKYFFPLWVEKTAPEPTVKSNKLNKSNAILIDLPKMSSQTTEIALNTSLSNAVMVPNNRVVMNLRLIDIDGNVENHSFLAGRDTAEHTFDCPDVTPKMQHQRATLYDSVPTDRPGVAPCESHSYQSVVKLDQPRVLKQIEFQPQELAVRILVKRISLMDSQQGLALPIQALQTSVNMTKWRQVEQLGTGGIYENKQVLPRTWVVSEVVPLKPEEIIQTIHTSRFPDGRIYQPEKTALVEIDDRSFSDISKTGDGNSSNGTAKILGIANTHVEVETTSDRPAFLILSDVNYPGWQAWIDGKPSKIFQTNYIQRGVIIPSGKHVVRFEFHSFSFKLGMTITVVSIGTGFYALRKRLS